MFKIKFNNKIFNFHFKSDSELIKFNRLYNGPIISSKLSNSIGDNINGPSVIKVPNWIEKPLGKYYLYFASHNGKYIRLAYSNSLSGEWKIFEPGTLQINETTYCNHIASPDVHVDNMNKNIIMYYHGSNFGCKDKNNRGQTSKVAISKDGINFKSNNEILGRSYFRVFEHDNNFFSIEKGSLIKRSNNRFKDFVPGPRLELPNARHFAPYVRNNVLYLFYSNIGDKPEKLVCSLIDLTEDWLNWKVSNTQTILEPKTEYEGGHLKLEKSKKGKAKGKVRQLRDPAIFIDEGITYLLYSVAGESGIAIGKLEFVG
jgi:hypothetical protein